MTPEDLIIDKLDNLTSEIKNTNAELHELNSTLTKVVVTQETHDKNIDKLDAKTEIHETAISQLNNETDLLKHRILALEHSAKEFKAEIKAIKENQVFVKPKVENQSKFNWIVITMIITVIGKLIYDALTK